MADRCEDWPLIGYVEPLDVDPSILAAAKEAAQAFLNGVTGHRFGTCTYSQRFQVRTTDQAVCGSPLVPATCCSIKLSRVPVQSIIEVRVDGAVIDPSGYEMVGGGRLARSSGCWPQSDDCDPGRVEVDYTAGVPLVVGSYFYAMAGTAMSEIVREYVEALSGRTCKLPSRFVSVARQGVTTQALDPELFMRLGMTGLPLTDNLIRTVNPNGLRRKSRVVSIDGPRRH